MENPLLVRRRMLMASLVGETIDGGWFSVYLNRQWKETSVTNPDIVNYLQCMSYSNYHVHNGFASVKIEFQDCPNFYIYINSYAESTYDYTIAWNLDKTAPKSNPSSSSSGVKAHTRGKQYSPNGSITSNYTRVEYPNDGGKHFVWVTYRKDSSANVYDDRGYMLIPRNKG